MENQPLFPVGGSDYYLDLAFGETSPKITQYPHCIFPATSNVDTPLFETIDEPIGIWGDRLLVGPTGESYLEPESGEIVEDFKYWALPENQAWARKHCFGKAGAFTMAIPANTTEEVLRHTYAIAGSESDTVFHYYDCIRYAADWITDLRWALIPLEYEYTYAMLVARAADADLVKRIRRRLLTDRITPVFSVEGDDSGQQVWPVQ